MGSVLSDPDGWALCEPLVLRWHESVHGTQPGPGGRGHSSPRYPRAIGYGLFRSLDRDRGTDGTAEQWQTAADRPDGAARRYFGDAEEARGQVTGIFSGAATA